MRSSARRATGGVAAFRKEWPGVTCSSHRPEEALHNWAFAPVPLPSTTSRFRVGCACASVCVFGAVLYFCGLI